MRAFAEMIKEAEEREKLRYALARALLRVQHLEAELDRRPGDVWARDRTPPPKEWAGWRR